MRGHVQRDLVRRAAVALGILLCVFGSTPGQAQINSKLAAGPHRATVRGVNFWYTVAGTGPVLIVQAPGWGIGSQYLRNGLRPLEQTFTLVFYDTRGSGASSRPSDAAKMSTSEMVEDLEGLRRYWGLDTIDLLGHSHGGAIALGYAIRYPGRTRDLVLVDSTLLGLNSAPFINRELLAREGDPRFASALAATRGPDPVIKTDAQFAAALHSVLPLYFYDPVANASKLALNSLAFPSAWVNQTFEAAEAKTPLVQTTSLGKVRARSMVLVGSNDFICPPPVAKFIYEGIDRAGFVEIERSGHFPWIENPAMFFAAVESFLNSNG